MNAARVASLKILVSVIANGRSFATENTVLNTLSDPRDRSLASEIVHGVLRWRWKLAAILQKILNKPVRKKDTDIYLILMMAVYELIEHKTPAYAIVDEAVKLTISRKKNWAKGLVNGALRTYLREPDKYLSDSSENEEAIYSHPQWLIDQIKKDWPEHWESVLTHNNHRPPLWIRVNVNITDTATYKSLFSEKEFHITTHPHAKEALQIDPPVNVKSLPNFDKGFCSVQDVGSQLVARLVSLNDGMRVLDLCSAPGGKTCHMLEIKNLKELVAVDIDEKRLQQVAQNLSRLNLQARLLHADATKEIMGLDKESFDRILVDAPCSATGVIRRHPDIKTLRKVTDIDGLVNTQSKILQNAWQLLKPGGYLLYVTCSVLRQENDLQIEDFLKKHADAEVENIDSKFGVCSNYGLQILPGMDNSDGFYYSRIHKQQ